MKKIALAAAVAALLPTSAFAATDQGEATAFVVSPITITHQVGAVLDFGAFSTATPGQVIVSDAGASVPGGVVQLGTVSADGFDVSGDASRSFSIVTGPGSVTNGFDTMNFTTSAAASGSLDGTGNASFSVGGTLTVAGGESTGTYTGSYDATVEYN